MSSTATKPADAIEPVSLRFDDDGLVPNNQQLPFVVYPGAVVIAGHRDPATLFEQAFAENGWGRAWRNGIYDFVHFHSMIHEVLGVACGQALVRFGGRLGRELELKPGDVAILPAGTGHQRLSATADLLVVGAYPAQGTFDLCRPTPAEHARARNTIPFVPLPQADPLYGEQGPLMRLWQA